VKDELIRYRPGVDPKPVDRTDWERVDRMTDADIEAAALADPDAQPLTDAELSRAFRPRALRELRGRLGLSQEEFADRFGFDLQTLQDWEQARGVPDNLARNYLRVIERDPEAVATALQD
jgi:putative transcriptional regulator